MLPDHYCQEKTASSGSSFYYSFLFLPPKKRQAITALYAFCREVDDVVDECKDPQLAAIKLSWWRTEIDRLYQGNPQHPVTKALQNSIAEFALPQEHLMTIIDGMAMDLQQTRYLDFHALSLYCYRVAAVVGLLAAKIFGYNNPKTEQYAHDLGIAFQLTNIIRDVGEDARRGRIYLPIEDLQQFNVKASEILNAQYSDRFCQLMEFQIVRAEKYYQQALEKLPTSDLRNQKPGLVMASIYRTLLVEIKRDGCRVLTHRTTLTPLRKLWLAAKTWLTTG